MPFIRSLIYWILFYISVAILIFGYFPLALFIKDKTDLADRGAKLWSRMVLFLLKVIMGIDHEIINKDKIPATPCIIACKHESTWETIVFHLICRHPAYIYKKELLKVPFYGWYVRYMSGAQVDRSGKASALKDLIRQSKDQLQKGHNIVIFPQGTRVPYGVGSEKYPYQVGTAALYLACNVPVVPAALDSGKFWPKGFLIKKSGRIKIKFLDPIQPGLKKEDFMRELEERTEKNSREL